MMAFNKVVLQSTSRMSLNDRFTGLRSAFDATDGESAGLVQRRQVVQASRKNQRLAQQMEHRPAVIAALRGSSRGGRGRVAVGGGLLRGARGARGVIRVGGPTRGVGDARATFRGTTRGGFTRGIRRATAGFRGTRGASASYRGVSAGRGAGSIRGINFRTGAPLRASAGAGRGALSNGSEAVAAAAVPVKSRLAVQGRLSGPTVATTRSSGGAQRGWVRGGFKAAATGFTRGTARGGSFRGRLGAGRARGGAHRGRGAAVAYNTGFQTRTFRGRGRGSRGTRGSRGGYSQQWENGY